MVDIIIPGTPVAMQRAKGFYNKNTGHMHHYYKNDKELRAFEQLVKIKAAEIFTRPLSGPVRLSVYFLMPRPSYLIWKKKAMPRVHCWKRPDNSNLIKTVEDALNGVVYHDDAQISEEFIWREYHAGDEGPKTIIRIEEIKDEEATKLP
jgi:Holliday junction resolvase RusA-like endonuclease